MTLDEIKKHPWLKRETPTEDEVKEMLKER